MKKAYREINFILVCILLPALAMAQNTVDTLKVKAITQNPHGSISIPCDACHATGDWKTTRKDMAFDHNTQTDFVLEGQHRSGDCKACHANNQFAGSKTECFQCHNDVHKGQLGKQCSQCHTSKSWEPFNFKQQHDQTRFPLIGKHATTDCQSCHKNQQENEFKGLTTVCSGCHLKDFIAASNPNHAQHNIPTTCEVCHTPQGWSPARIIDHTSFGFELTQGHKNIPCGSCHANGNYSTVSNDCYGCHRNDYEQSNDPQHLSGHFSTNCTECHTTAAGWSPANFDHAVTAFPLTGAHLTAQNKCISCHASGFTNTSTLCYACHQNDFTQTNDPNHVSQNFSTNCEQCHTTNPDWKPATFDHANSNFPLTGGHLLVQNQCQKCHGSGYIATPTNCYACHQQDFVSAAEPNHIAGNFSTHCEQCHTANPGWKPAQFDHANSTFPFTGGHLIVKDQCQQCHASGFVNTPTDCYACHQQDFVNTTNPNHLTGNYSTACIVCHSTNPGWQPVSYNHDLTNFPLTGAHFVIQNQCVSCHSSGYVNTPSACYSCHQTDYNNSTNPNHQTLAFPINCEQCHTTSAGWHPTIFDHNTTQFPLTGAHITVANQCSQCHTGSLSGTSTACYFCHQTAYTSATDPNHQTLAFPTNCEQCHTTNAGWTPSIFDHNTTQFPLTGAHITVANQCSQCHTGSLTGTSTACYSCHQSAYTGTTNPDHAANNFPTNCELCHTTNLGWSPSTFDHSTTQFPLTGAHLTIANQCVQCHASGYVSTPTNCYACHQTDYNNAADPNHAANSFPTNCEQCHTTSNWKPSTFDHSATQFPLTGAHQAIANQCTLCHASGYSNTPTNCYACHVNDYNTSANPSHTGLQFPTTCENGCHNTTGWVPSVFNHTSYTTYALLGAHQSIANQCSKCHTGNLTSASSACYSCHQADYNNATKPNHGGSGFSQDCQNCHGQNTWIPWTVSHTQYFPINSGKHNGQWTGCGGGSGDGAGCHTDNNDFRLYSCVHCHEHSLSSMNDHHNEVKDYVYNSFACFTCHPQGSTGGGKVKYFIR